MKTSPTGRFVNDGPVMQNLPFHTPEVAALKESFVRSHRFEFKVYWFPRANLYHDQAGVYAKTLAPTGASWTWFVGETIGQ